MSKSAAKLEGYSRNAIAACHDAAMAGLSFIAALYLRLEYGEFELAVGLLIYGTVAFIAISMIICVTLRLYRGLWRYASPRDMLTILKVVSLSILIFYSALFLFNRLEGMPRSVFFIHWLLFLLFLTAPRLAYRAFKDRSLRYALSDASAGAAGRRQQPGGAFPDGYAASRPCAL